MFANLGKQGTNIFADGIKSQISTLFLGLNPKIHCLFEHENGLFVENPRKPAPSYVHVHILY